MRGVDRPVGDCDRTRALAPPKLGAVHRRLHLRPPPRQTPTRSDRPVLVSGQCLDLRPMPMCVCTSASAASEHRAASLCSALRPGSTRSRFVAVRRCCYVHGWIRPLMPMSGRLRLRMRDSRRDEATKAHPRRKQPRGRCQRSHARCAWKLDEQRTRLRRRPATNRTCHRRVSSVAEATPRTQPPIGV